MAIQYIFMFFSLKKKKIKNQKENLKKKIGGGPQKGSRWGR